MPDARVLHLVDRQPWSGLLAGRNTLPGVAVLPCRMESVEETEEEEEETEEEALGPFLTSTTTA